MGFIDTTAILFNDSFRKFHLKLIFTAKHFYLSFNICHEDYIRLFSVFQFLLVNYRDFKAFFYIFM